MKTQSGRPVCTTSWKNSYRHSELLEPISRSAVTNVVIDDDGIEYGKLLFNVYRCEPAIFFTDE